MKIILDGMNYIRHSTFRPTSKTPDVGARVQVPDTFLITIPQLPSTREDITLSPISIPVFGNLLFFLSMYRIIPFQQSSECG